MNLPPESPIPPGAAPAGPGPRASAFLRWSRDLLIATAICAFVILFVYQPFRVDGASMSPTLRDRDLILVNKFVYRFGDVRRGDIVVFRGSARNGRALVKRVAGLEGDVVEIRYGVLHVNGRIVPEPYVYPENAPAEAVGPVEVPRGCLYVLGDHRSVSADSRTFDCVPRSAVRGKAVLRYWPFRRMERLR